MAYSLYHYFNNCYTLSIYESIPQAYKWGKIYKAKELIQKTLYFPPKNTDCTIKSGPLTTNDERFQEPHHKMNL